MSSHVTDDRAVIAKQNWMRNVYNYAMLVYLSFDFFKVRVFPTVLMST